MASRKATPYNSSRPSFASGSSFQKSTRKVSYQRRKDEGVKKEGSEEEEEEEEEEGSDDEDSEDEDSEDEDEGTSEEEEDSEEEEEEVAVKGKGKEKITGERETTEPGRGQNKKPNKVNPAEVKYLRGLQINPRAAEDKKVRGILRKADESLKKAAQQAAKNEILLQEEAGFLEAEGMERTYNYKQDNLVKTLDMASSKKYFNLDLNEFGPYRLNYTKNGRHVLIGGRKGHVATFDWHISKLTAELHLKETVRDVRWLHNESMFAVAQKKYVYIYDHSGLELHRMKNHIQVNRLEFLPYHFLLVTIGGAGYLKYHDTSIGTLVNEIPTKHGECDVMVQNPSNAIIHLGHNNGVVTLWSPNSQTPLVSMLCHKGPVKALAIDNGGNYMVTSGMDGHLKIWDVRTYKELHSYYTPTPATSMSISQRDLLSVGYGSHVQIWKDAFRAKQRSPYMTHLIPSSPIQDLEFCPFEDVLGIGHSKGFTSILVPGSGEPNFDALEANPYQTKKQRRETEVKSLLEKLQPEMITLDPTYIGSITRSTKEELEARKKSEFEANNPGEAFVPRNRTRGKNSAAKRYLRKRKNVIDEKRMKIVAEFDKKKLDREKRLREEAGHTESGALSRFTKRRKPM